MGNFTKVNYSTKRTFFSYKGYITTSLLKFMDYNTQCEAIFLKQINMTIPITLKRGKMYLMLVVWMAKQQAECWMSNSFQCSR